MGLSPIKLGSLQFGVYPSPPGLGGCDPSRVGVTSLQVWGCIPPGLREPPQARPPSPTPLYLLSARQPRLAPDGTRRAAAGDPAGGVRAALRRARRRRRQRAGRPRSQQPAPPPPRVLPQTSGSRAAMLRLTAAALSACRLRGPSADIASLGTAILGGTSHASLLPPPL